MNTFLLLASLHITYYIFLTVCAFIYHYLDNTFAQLHIKYKLNNNLSKFKIKFLETHFPRYCGIIYVSDCLAVFFFNFPYHLYGDFELYLNVLQTLPCLLIEVLKKFKSEKVYPF